VLVALEVTGERVEAAHELAGDRFTCPACAGPMVLKRGRVTIAHFAHFAHFAHLPGAECWSEPESVTHLRAKRLLAERFREQGYQVRLEETHHRHGRRVDVAVTMPTGHRVAVEVQDSAIAVEEAKVPHATGS
jgi:competence CoiA-like predicted nuclease